MTVDSGPKRLAGRRRLLAAAARASRLASASRRVGAETRRVLPL